MPILTAEDHQKALKEVEALMDLHPGLGSTESDSLIALSIEIEAWEVKMESDLVTKAEKPGLYCRHCGHHLCIKGVCTIYCPNKQCKSN